MDSLSFIGLEKQQDELRLDIDCYGSAPHIGGGMAFTAAHLFTNSKSELDMGFNETAYFTTMRHFEEFKAPLSPANKGQLMTGHIGNDAELVAFMDQEASFPPARLSGLVYTKDLALLQLSKQPIGFFRPGKIKDDGIVKTCVINGYTDPGSYKKSLESRHGVPREFDAKEYVERIDELHPDLPSMSEGSGFVNEGKIYHDRSSAEQASGGALLNSENEIIGIHLGVDAEDFGQHNVGLYLSNPDVKEFLRENLLPRLALKCLLVYHMISSAPISGKEAWAILAGLFELVRSKAYPVVCEPLVHDQDLKHQAVFRGHNSTSDEVTAKRRRVYPFVCEALSQDKNFQELAKEGPFAEKMKENVARRVYDAAITVLRDSLDVDEDLLDDVFPVEVVKKNMKMFVEEVCLYGYRFAIHGEKDEYIRDVMYENRGFIEDVFGEECY
ncbi:hypothetical protein BJ508DRAFT_360842 [Ascobolus immersus RN42]|uniref:Serine protease n=1 Tax=Ascobolus immersus RN42 TaxID=1160509 RepID=A0A3N4I9W9_ASCIM|nr:hypothetical protein BJ508DRAFT_360842 [Ascobolus immersus RN42]